MSNPIARKIPVNLYFHTPCCWIAIAFSKNYLFLEQMEGYVKPQEKSTFRFSTMRGVFEHRAQNA